jgi:hypothetical protein
MQYLYSLDIEVFLFFAFVVLKGFVRMPFYGKEILAKPLDLKAFNLQIVFNYHASKMVHG